MPQISKDEIDISIGKKEITNAVEDLVMNTSITMEEIVTHIQDTLCHLYE